MTVYYHSPSSPDLEVTTTKVLLWTRLAVHNSKNRKKIYSKWFFLENSLQAALNRYTRKEEVKASQLKELTLMSAVR